MAEPPEDRYYGAEVKHLLEESRRQAQRRESMFNEEARSGPVNDTYRAAALVKTPHLQRAEDLYQKKKPATVSGASSGHPIDTDRLPGLGNGIKETQLWSVMPRTQVSPDVQKDLRFLRLRDILDPKRHYRKDRISKLVPGQFEIGTVVQGSTEYLQGRVPKREQKTTMTSEILAHEAAEGRLKRKYIQLQAAKARGKKSHYRKLQAQRSHKVKHP